MRVARLLSSASQRRGSEEHEEQDIRQKNQKTKICSQAMSVGLFIPTATCNSSKASDQPEPRETFVA